MNNPSLRMSYSDVLSMPTYERRFFLGQIIKQKVQADELREKQKESAKTTTGKGTRQTTLSGDALKNRIKSGDLPTK